MKTIGTTNEGGYLVEMTRDEYSAFGRLSEAIEGKSLDSLRLNRDNPRLAPDFSGVFGAIDAFALAQFRINAIRQIADEFEEAITHWKSKER